MFSDTKINYELFDCNMEIEKIDQLIIQLTMKKEELLEKRTKLKRALEEAQSHVDFNNWKLAQDMAFEMLNEQLLSE